jgi:hypothetical protein
MVEHRNQEVKQLVDQAGGLSLGTDDFLIAIRTDSGELEPQLVGSIDDFLQRSNGYEGADEIRRCLRQQDRRGPFVGMLHSGGAVLFEFPPPVRDWLPPVVNNKLVARAICSGIRLGEVFEVVRNLDGTLTVVGRRATAHFMRRWRHCFDAAEQPRLDKIYLAIIHEDGVFLVEI